MVKIVTNDNFVNISDIPIVSDPTMELDIIYYPTVFKEKISKKLLPTIRSLEFEEIKYCIRNRLETMPTKAYWMCDNKTWTYVIDELHIQGFKSRDFPLFTRCLQLGVQMISENNYNACLITKHSSKTSPLFAQQAKWLDQTNTSFVFFGDSCDLYITSSGEQDREIVASEGDMIILRHNTPEWSYNLTSKGTTYVVAFLSIDKTKVKKMPKAQKKCVVNEIKSIYLDTEQRKELAKAISNEFANFKEKTGNQCVNGENKSLLQYLEMKEKLGEGSFGNVYAGCSPAPCTHNSYKFAIKLSVLTKTSLHNLYKPYQESWHEYIYLNDMIKPIIEMGICPNLPLLYKTYICNKCKFTFDGLPKNGPCAIYLTELASGDFNYWSKMNHNQVEYQSALFQIMAGLDALQVHAQLVTIDIKAENILLYKVEPGGFWVYTIREKEFYVPNTGYLFVVNDFGIAHTYDPDFKEVRDRKDIKYFDLGQRYAMVINHTISPFKITNSYYKNKEKYTEKMKWGTGRIKKNWKTTETSSAGVTQIEISTGKIKSLDIDFTKKQLKTLEDHGIPADSTNKEFYKHPSIIFPMEYAGDTQDVIKMFIGSLKHSIQGWCHEKQPNIPDTFKNTLTPYLNYINNEHSPNNPAKILAGEFIYDYFSKHTNFTTRPSGKKLQTYNIS